MKKVILFFLIVFFCCLVLTSTVEAGTYTVTNNNDSGAGSLRQAITDANAVAGSHTLNFSGAIGTITLLSALPNLTKEVTFDLSSAEGTVVLTGDASGSSEQVTFDNGAGSGTFNFDGASSVFTGTDDTKLNVGYSGSGTLNITNGAAVSGNGLGTIGYNSGSTGTVTVDGAGSTLTTSDYYALYVASHGSGTLNITSGGTVTSNGHRAIAFYPGSTGTVTVNGAGSTWTGSGLELRGGTGTLNITNGGTVTSNCGSIAHNSGSTGTVTVDGAGSTWTNSAQLWVGMNGTGTLNITNGGAVSNTLAYIGRYSGSTGSVAVDGAGSTWTSSSNLRVGDSGTGTLNITNGGTVTSANGVINSSSTVTVDGAGSTWTNSGSLTVNNGTLNIRDNAIVSALGTGTVTNNAMVDVGTNTLTLGSDYTQDANTTLNVTVASSSTSGSIAAAGNAAVSAASTVDVNVTGYVANGSAYTIIDGAAAGGGVNVPGTITDNSAVLTFAGTTDTDDLTLTADRTNTYTAIGTTKNEKTAGSALEAAGGNGTGDMISVLGQLDQLSSQTSVRNALGQVTPCVDGGIITTNYTALSLFQENVTGHLADARSGVSTGDMSRDVDIWAKEFGNYLDQDKRDGIDGYKAHTLGTTIGVDFLVTGRFRAGVCGGYAFSRVDSKQSNIGDTDIDSYQGTLYGGYDGGPFYIDVAGSFAYNRYSGSRTISFGNIARTADSDYDGLQYSTYIEGGYTFETNGLEITPMASLRYIYLYLDDYTETGANALNLKVDSQDYNFLQSGLGAKFAYPVRNNSLTFIPEAHGMWLYDFIGDGQQTTSTFTGGGPSFKTDGADPAQHSFNVGTSLTLVTSIDISLVVAYDFEVKDDFYGHSGSVTIKYSF